jgi:DNA end-binding protein Ku
LPKRKQAHASDAQPETAGAPARSLWSGTITFGLVSIPVDLLTAVRPRQTAMKLVDSDGHALGRRYHCSKEGKELDYDELVRGYETDDGKMVVITDEEFESVAPELSGDIELRNFVPLEQIPPLYFQRPYFLAPAGRSVKAYYLLAAIMEKTGRVGIGSFVMRGHEYLVAIISDHGVLRADTLRYADEIRTPETVGLPKPAKVLAAKVNKLVKAIDELSRRDLALSELEDREAQALSELVESKQKEGEDVVHPRGLEEVEADADGGGAKIIDLMDVLRKSLSKNAVVTRADSGPPISLAERRAQRAAQTQPKKKARSKPKASSTRSASRKRRRRA